MCTPCQFFLVGLRKYWVWKCHLLQTSLKSDVIMERYKMQYWITKI